MFREAFSSKIFAVLLQVHLVEGSAESTVYATGNKSRIAPEEIPTSRQSSNGKTATASEPSLIVLFAISLLWIPFNRWKKNETGHAVPHHLTHTCNDS
jgi:hypothetical protein